MEQNNTIMYNNNSNRRNLTLRIFVNEQESLLIKGQLNRYNEILRNTKYYREKSMSGFLRDIVLNSLLNLNSSLEPRIEQLEKYIMRNIALTFESMVRNFGESEARNILKKAKLNMVNLEESTGDEIK